MKSILSQTSSKVTNEIETSQKEQNKIINQIQEQSENEFNQLKLMVNKLKDEIRKISEQKVNLSLTQFTIPSSVTTIKNSAFSGWSSLTQITIPSSVTSIGNDSFSGCSSLTKITIPSSVISIGDYAFKGCSSLTQITIPSSVTSIGGSVFSECSSLTQISIPPSLIKYLIPTGKTWDMKDNDNNCFTIEDNSCEVISSSIYEGERFVKHLFDGQKEQDGKYNVWASVYKDSNAFIQINFTKPVISNIIKITSRKSGYYQQTPTHFELFGINNQNQEESLSEIRVSWEKDQTKLFPFINEKPYSKYKFKFYEFDCYAAIAELNLGKI